MVVGCLLLAVAGWRLVIGYVVVGCWSSFDVRRSLFVVCCLFVRCPLPLVRPSLFVGCSLMFDVCCLMCCAGLCLFGV